MAAVTQQPATTVVIAETHFDIDPISVYCPGCEQQITTEVQFEKGTCWVLACVLLCLIFWPASCCMLCTSWFKDSVHACPRCHRVLGRYRR